MANRYTDRCSTSLIIVEMQIKTTVSYHFPAFSVAVINKTEMSVGLAVEQREPSDSWWECKLVE